MGGTIDYIDLGLSAQMTFVRWVNGADNIQWSLYTASTYTGGLIAQQVVGGVTDFNSIPNPGYSPGLNVPIRLAARHGATFIQSATDGTATSANTTPVALPDLSASTFQLGSTFAGTISLFRGWGEDIGQAGIEEASS